MKNSINYSATLSEVCGDESIRRRMIALGYPELTKEGIYIFHAKGGKIFNRLVRITSKYSTFSMDYLGVTCESDFFDRVINKNFRFASNLTARAIFKTRGSDIKVYVAPRSDEAIEEFVKSEENFKSLRSGEGFRYFFKEKCLGIYNSLASGS